jgi:hypothetical protein
MGQMQSKLADNSNPNAAPIIPKMMAAIEEGLLEAIQLGNQLENKLYPVLRLDPPTVSAPGGAGGAVERGTRLSDTLTVHLGAIHHLNTLLASLLRRLEM